jgi:hypothetical protein
MLTRWLVAALVLAGCAGVPPRGDPATRVVVENPGVVRLLLSKEEAFRLSRAGILDPSSPSGLTDRFRYRVAIEAHVAEVLRQRGLCPRGFHGLEISAAPEPFETMITVACD